MFYSNVERKSALMTAACNGCKDIAELLITNGASVRVVDDKGYTPLHLASIKGHKDVVELLIANGIQIDTRAEDSCTPLYMAAWGQHQGIAQLLLDYGAAMEPDIAVMLGDIQLVKRYLVQGLDANSKLAKGLTKGESWLITVIGHKSRNRELVELLLNHGAKVNEKTGTFKFSPLHRATIVGCRDICELLIARGADVKAEDKHGNTPIHWAARLGHQDIVEYLLDCDANVNALDIGGSSALFDAAQQHHLQVVEYLLSRGAEVNLTDEQGFTPLLRAFQKLGSDEIVRVLVAYGAEVNVRGHQGLSPLHIAVAQKNKNIVELLLAHGAREGLE